MALHLSREEALKFLVAAGFKGSAKHNDVWLERKIINIRDFVDNETELQDEEADMILRDVLGELADGGAIHVTDEETLDDDTDETEEDVLPPEPPEKPKKKSRRQKRKEAKAVEAKPKAKAKSKAEPAVAEDNDKKDQFGYRVGSKASVFAACLNDGLKSMKTLLEESGIEKQQYGVLRELEKREIVVKESGKYKLA